MIDSLGKTVDNSNAPFLATTALEEFWDTTKPILFLGEWCLLHGRRAFWEPLGGKLLESPYNESKSVHAAFSYINEIYERILPLIGDSLNFIHGKSYSNRYWRIILGPWFFSYLSVIYDKFTHLKCALEHCPELSTIGLSEESFIVPSDTFEFNRFLLEDSYNLQFYTKILVALGKTFPCKGLGITQNPLYNQLDSNSWRQNVVNSVSKVYAGFASKVFQSILIKSSYFPKSALLLLTIKNAGRVLPILGRSTKSSLPQYDSSIRKKLKKISIGDGEFERCLSSMLFDDIPKSFVEEYDTVCSESIKNYPHKSKAIFSANSWYYDEMYKQWAATSAEEGALLLGTQHGGSYGGLANMFIENHETAIVDYYYSWGWTRGDCTAEVIPMPATNLANRKKIVACNRKTGILWVATTSPRYLVQFPSSPKKFTDYLTWQMIFVNKLFPKIREKVLFRPHREDPGWDIVQRINDDFPNIRIEKWDIPFQESLSNCRLYVCDHFSTTFAEALAVNKPTILFWSPLSNELRPEAQMYYDLLRKNGILYDTPESAGLAVNLIYDDVETWWNDPERQVAVKKFCDRFARITQDAIELWNAEFKRILAIPFPRNNRVE